MLIMSTNVDRTVITLFILTVLGIAVLDFYGDIVFQNTNTTNTTTNKSVTFENFENYIEHYYHKMKTLVSNTIVTGCSGWHLNTNTKYPKNSK